MFDFPLFSFNGALCVAAVVVATFLRVGNQEATALACALLANFIFCSLEYTPYAFRLVLADWGVKASAPDMWMLADTLFGCTAILVGFWYRWAQSLWALACCQIVAHLSYQMHLFDQYAYSDTLQVVLLAQLAVFFVIGGPSVRDDLRSRIARFRRARRPVAARTCDAAKGEEE